MARIEYLYHFKGDNNSFFAICSPQEASRIRQTEVKLSAWKRLDCCIDSQASINATIAFMLGIDIPTDTKVHLDLCGLGVDEPLFISYDDYRSYLREGGYRRLL